MSRTEAIKREESMRYEFLPQSIISIEGTNYQLLQEVFADKMIGRRGLREKPFTALSSFSAATLREPHTEKQFERGTVFMASPKKGTHWK